MPKEKAPKVISIEEIKEQSYRLPRLEPESALCKIVPADDMWRGEHYKTHKVDSTTYPRYLSELGIDIE